MKRTIYLLIGIAISAFFLYLALPGLHLKAVAEAMRTANYWWIGPGIAVYFAGLWVRSWRWHFTLREIKNVPTVRLFPLTCIGYFGNNVYPFRAGEVLRSVVLKGTEQIAISSSLATVFIERIFDGLVMLLFVFIALPFAPMPDEYRRVVIVLTMLMLAATGVFIWMAVRPQRIIAVYSWFAERLLPERVRVRVDDLVERFLQGLSSLSNPFDVVMIFATSVLIWLLETVKYWFVMHAFPFEVSFIVLMLMNGLVNLATTLPSAPGYIGTFDTPGIETLVAFGVDRNLAASYTFTLHAALWLPVTLVGAFYFWRRRLHWSDLASASEFEQTDALDVGSDGSLSDRGDAGVADSDSDGEDRAENEIDQLPATAPH
ncbi:MAG: lysylphosphatidylglycerol synthase transmembrane domain-containing protein [Caldilineaceae bacterium]